MRRFLAIALAVLLGAGGYYAYYQSTKPKAKAGAGAGASAVPGSGKTDLASTTPPGPNFAEDVLPDSGLSRPGTEPAREPQPLPAIPAPAAAREPGSETPAVAKETVPAPAPAAPPAFASGDEVQSAIQRSEAAFKAGDRVNAAKALREAFEKGKDRADVDLLPQARQLFEIEEKGANDRPAAQPGAVGSSQRLEICKYLVARETQPAWRYRAALLLGGEEAKDPSPESPPSAWSHLTAAYLAASSKPERDRVLAVLNPFLQKNVFSKRFSPLVESYTVKGGDSLNRISKLKGTTEEAIARLNQLKTPTIQPGQRLIVLVGKPKIFVKKSDFRLWLLVGDRLLAEFSVGLGKDNSTPAAAFVITARQKEPVWHPRGEPPIPYGDPKNILGSRWLGFKDTEDLIGFGIHGTSDPTSIGKEASSGCIRMKNEDIEVLWDFIPLGTEVEIRE
jgi:nucleoid-associated protein YgaU